MSLKARVERLETGADEFILVRRCPRCGQAVVWADICGEPQVSAETCERHRLAPPPGPRDIVIRRTYGMGDEAG